VIFQVGFIGLLKLLQHMWVRAETDWEPPGRQVKIRSAPVILHEHNRARQPRHESPGFVFTFRHAYLPPDAPRARAPFDIDDECPAT
jgi:hypothetical protein